MAQAEDSKQPGAGLSPFAVRVISAMVIIPPVLAAHWLGGMPFNIMCVILLGIILWEWRGLCLQGAAAGALPYAPWLASGAVYALVICFMLIYIRADENGRETAVWMLTAVWAADIGAYFTGRAIGGPKLAPVISPNKTWAGFFGAVGSAALISWLAAWIFTGSAGLIHMALFGAVLGAVSQGGDLAVSWAKRRCGAKDAGNLIPGHGGVLDRVDGLMAAAAAVFILTLFYKAPLSP